MSMRMNAFHDIVNSYSKPGMGVNGMPPGGCPQTQGCSDGMMALNALLTIGGQFATAALQAKTGAAQEQNQQASHSNAAINKAMEGAQDALVQLPKNSAEYAKLQNQIDDLQAKLDAIDKIDENKGTLSALSNNFEGVSTSGGKNLKAVIQDINWSKGAVGQLDKFLSSANQLQAKQTMNEKIAEAEVKPTFSKYAGAFEYSGNDLGQAKSFIESKRNEYKTLDKDGKENFLEAIYKQDLHAAELADKQYAEKITAQNEVEKIKGQKEQLFKDATAVLTHATKGGTEGGSTITAKIGEITSIDTLQNAINQINNHIQSIEAETVTGKDGKQMSVADYVKTATNLEDTVSTGVQNASNKDALKAEKEKLEKQLTDSVKPQLEKLSKSYNDLNAILGDIKKCEDANAEVKEAKADYKDIKRADNKNRSFFQEVLGLNKDKETRGYAKSAIATEKAEASAAEKAFVDEYGARPTENFKKQVVEQMTFIKNTVKQAGLEELAKKLGFNFD